MLHCRQLTRLLTLCMCLFFTALRYLEKRSGIKLSSIEVKGGIIDVTTGASVSGKAGPVTAASKA